MRRTALAVAAAALLLSGCSATQDAVQSGGEFTFVAPGGQTVIRYDPPEARGSVTGISGESLLRPGETVGIDDYPGQVVVLNVWGEWCGPCREELPALQLVSESVEGATVLGIDVRDNRDAATDLLRNLGVTYDSIFDFPGRSLIGLSGYPRNTVPTTLVLDKQHRVAYVSLVQVRASELIPIVQELVDESG